MVSNSVLTFARGGLLRNFYAKPTFSVIVPVYNAQDYIARALESLTQQSFKQIEIICVDDCGSDNSASVLSEFATKDAQMKIVKNPHNLGLFETRRQGAAAAKGTTCSFVTRITTLTKMFAKDALKF